MCSGWKKTIRWFESCDLLLLCDDLEATLVVVTGRLNALSLVADLWFERPAEEEGLAGAGHKEKDRDLLCKAKVSDRMGSRRLSLPANFEC